MKKRLTSATLTPRQQKAVQDNRASASAPRSRRGKKVVAGHFLPETAWQLKKLAVDRQVSVQALLQEALDDLFEKYHLPRIGE